MYKFLLTLFLCFTAIAVNAQELNCQVNVNSSKIQGDKTIFNELQKALYELMNNTKWTQDKFKTEERIECAIQIIIDERVSTDDFKGSIQITSNRPVYKSSYDSPMLNFKDEKFQFRYQQYQTLQYNESGDNPNLLQVLAYYAYIIIGFDYDSYSLMGGSPYFNKAQQIVAQMSSGGEVGWKSFESTRNRYWLAENLNSNIFRPLRELEYQMHRKGLDMMFDKRDDAIRNIADAIEPLRAVNNQKPTSYIFQIFFTAKGDELVNIFKGDVVPADIKNKVKQVFLEVDPANSAKYNTITGG